MKKRLYRRLNIMKRFLTILSIPFVLAGVLFWSAGVMLKVAVSTLFSRAAKREVVQ